MYKVYCATVIGHMINIRLVGSYDTLDDAQNRAIKENVNNCWRDLDLSDETDVHLIRHRCLYDQRYARCRKYVVGEPPMFIIRQQLNERQGFSHINIDKHCCNLIDGKVCDNVSVMLLADIGVPLCRKCLSLGYQVLLLRKPDWSELDQVCVFCAKGRALHLLGLCKKCITNADILNSFPDCEV